MNGLADVDGFKICIHVCVWLGFPPLIVGQPNVRSIVDYYIKLNSATVVQIVVKLWNYLHPFVPKENESEI